jgi:hypothetical protein
MTSSTKAMAKMLKPSNMQISLWRTGRLKRKPRRAATRYHALQCGEPSIGRHSGM